MAIYRIDVCTKGEDSAGMALAKQAAELGLAQNAALAVRTRRIFLIDAEDPAQRVIAAAGELLADPIVETAQVPDRQSDSGGRIEIHLKPGVMDPVAASTEMALRDMGIAVKQVRTGRAYLFEPRLPRENLERIAKELLANGVIESVHFELYWPEQFAAGRQYEFQLRHVPLLQLDDEALTKLSREGHLFLSLAEMQAIQAYFRIKAREPTDIELETLAQTWSEHCVHKTLKSAVEVDVQDAEGQSISTRHYSNLIKETIFKSTMGLTEGGSDKQFCLSVFADNAGVVVFDGDDAVCFKVETHNHPSAIEPYGGSATGIGGVIRDVLGTGLGAKPIANTDVFCVAYPERPAGASLPHGVIHPKRILQQIVAGVRDYGNRMGIPTVNGAVYFDERYLGNPLVFCGCVGLIPQSAIAKAAQVGDAIVVVGGRTGRDGIHGATFSSAELTDTHADEFSHAVQIGDAITEKKVADVLLQARDRGLFTAVTDCGAGGLSSAVGEMGEKIGACVDLEKVPLKYAGLTYAEIWISEAQERMVFSVPQDKVAEVLKLCADENVEATCIGVFGSEGLDENSGPRTARLPHELHAPFYSQGEPGGPPPANADNSGTGQVLRESRQTGSDPPGELVLKYNEVEVGRLTMEFLHHGVPMPTRQAVVGPPPPATPPLAMRLGLDAAASLEQRLLAVLAHPNVASKHWIIRQYDHEVQGGSVIKPLTGAEQIGPSDAAVLRPKLQSDRGIAIACGLAPHQADPYKMALWAIDEAVRNVVAVGADMSHVALLDNFCWPSVDDPQTMGTLVRACEACYDAARELGIPFISGKDSLHNQFTDAQTGQVIRIPNTLLISAIAVIQDVRRCITMDLKTPGNVLALVRQTQAEPELSDLAQTHRHMADAIAEGLVVSCHDVSDGGMLAAAAEMCLASGLGLDLKFLDSLYFREGPGAYLVEVAADSIDALRDKFTSLRTGCEPCATVIAEGLLRVGNYKRTLCEIPVASLRTAWRGTLDW
jgi:phosphoribosylformylglycinamidine synthase